MRISLCATKQLSRIIFRILSALTLAILMTGCAGTSVAPDLLNQIHVAKPIVDQTLTIDTVINQEIDRYEMVEESIKESLETALINANIFGKDSSHPYELIINVKLFSQSPMSFGNFGNRLDVNYELYDANKNTIINESIYTIAESDKFIFSGDARARRARAVNIAKNVNQFLELLQTKL